MKLSLRLFQWKNQERTARRPLVRLQMESLENRLTPSLVNHGGAILAHVQAQALYLGSDWATNDVLNKQAFGTGGQSFEDFVGKTVGGSYLSTLGKAGFTGNNGTVGTGTAAGGVIDNLSLPSTLLDSQIQADLESAIANNLAQQPNPNTLYFVFVQDNVIVDLGNGQTSVNAFSAYHSSFSSGGQSIRYAVVPYAGGSVNNSQAPWLNAFDSMSVAASHELAEAATDPDGHTWWDRSGNENGDVVNGSTIYLNGYAVQREGAIPASISNFLPLTPAGAAASQQVAFSLRQNGDLFEFSSVNPGGAKIAGGVATISDQGIDDFGQPMIDIVYANGTAAEYHDFADRSVPTFTSNPSLFPFTNLGSGVKQAVAGQAVSYVLLTSGKLKEFVDPNYFTQKSGYGVNSAGPAGVIASNVSAISAGTDMLGGNSIDYFLSGNLYEWRDVTAKATQLASNVTTFSAGQQGYHAWVSNGAGYLYSEDNRIVSLISDGVAGAVTSVVVGVDATGGYQLVVIHQGGAADTYSSSANSWTSLGSNVLSASKSFNGAIRILLLTTDAIEYTNGNAYWSDTGDKAVS